MLEQFPRTTCTGTPAPCESWGQATRSTSTSRLIGSPPKAPARNKAPTSSRPRNPESDDERAEYDFRTERAVRHAEFIAVAQDFARRMTEGDIGWPPPLTSDTS